MDAARDAVLPLRPLTVGELLDASVGVLRRCGWPILALGLLLAAVQQAISDLATARMPGFFSSFDAVGLWWVWLACRAGAESLIIVILAAPASAAAAAILVGETPGRAPRDRWFGPLRWLAAPGGRWPAVLATGAGVGALATGSVLLCGLPWLVVYGLTGLVVPVLVADRAPAGRVLLRPLQLMFAGGGRAAAIRLLGYLGWLLVRLAVGYAGDDLVGVLPAQALAPLLAALPWILVNTVAFPALACLDACIHLENRMRTEGLDLALARGRHRRATLEAI